jgi:hypothetical protein
VFTVASYFVLPQKSFKSLLFFEVSVAVLMFVHYRAADRHAVFPACVRGDFTPILAG